MRIVQATVHTTEGPSFPVIGGTYKEVTKNARAVCALRGWHLDEEALQFDIQVALATHRQSTTRMYMEELFISSTRKLPVFH